MRVSAEAVAPSRADFYAQLERAAFEAFCRDQIDRMAEACGDRAFAEFFWM